MVLWLPVPVVVGKRDVSGSSPVHSDPKRMFGYTSLPCSGGQHCTLNGVKMVRVWETYFKDRIVRMHTPQCKRTRL